MMAFVIIITEILLVNSKKKKTTTKITGKEKIKSPINDAKKKKRNVYRVSSWSRGMQELSSSAASQRVTHKKPH